MNRRLQSLLILAIEVLLVGASSLAAPAFASDTAGLSDRPPLSPRMPTPRIDHDANSAVRHAGATKAFDDNGLALPASFQVDGTVAFAYGPDGTRVYYQPQPERAGTWWDGVCTHGESRYETLRDYPRPRPHPRMKRSYARMYCGKKDRESELPDSEGAFGIRHIRGHHKSDFVQPASWVGSSWGNWMHWAIGRTLEAPSWRTVQNSIRFCYEERIGFQNPSGSTVDRRVIVILGETGVRIMSSFVRSDRDYCEGQRF